MRAIAKVKRQRIFYRESFNNLIQLWFFYHFLFYRSLIFRGLKLKAFNFFLQIKKGLKRKENFDPNFVFFLCLIQITPVLFLKKIRVSGVILQIPLPLSFWQKLSYACKWVLRLLINKNRVFRVNTIVDALIFSLDDKGISMEKKLEVYSFAEANRHLLRTKIFNR